MYLDAGDIKNRHVMQRISKVLQLLAVWDRRVLIAWWGQTNKSMPDVDELEDIGKIQYLKPDIIRELVNST